MNNNNGRNNFEENIFNGPTNIAGRDIVINKPQPDEERKAARYEPVPLWRSPFTLAILSWISVFMGIVGILPLYKVTQPLWDLIKGAMQPMKNYNNQVYVIVFVIIIFLLALVLSLRKIASKETRHPLLFNYAISGKEKRLIIEKIYIDKCPICGGKMKYYNKPVEWREILRDNGGIKKEVTKRISVLECKRNPKHCYEVDPAEERV